MTTPDRSDDAHLLISFLNALPTDSDLLNWSGGFRNALSLLFDDVDRITVSVNRRCEFDKPDPAPSTMTISQVGTADGINEPQFTVTTHERGVDRADQVLDSIRKQGGRLDDYADPHVVNYFLDGGAYLGVIMLWRLNGRAPISERSLQLLERIGPFVRFSLTDAIARHYYARPYLRAYYDVYEELVTATKMTDKEQGALMLQLMGRSYEQIASEVGASVSAVKKRLAAAHSKAGVQSHIELFAKFFSPRILAVIRDDDQR